MGAEFSGTIARVPTDFSHVVTSRSRGEFPHEEEALKSLTFVAPADATHLFLTGDARLPDRIPLAWKFFKIHQIRNRQSPTTI